MDLRSFWVNAVRAAALLCALGAAACSQETVDPSVIPRAALLGDPSRIQLRLSPDGETMSFLAPDGGVLNLWVGPAGRYDEARPITRDRDKGIHAHFWAPGSDVILYTKELGADGTKHIVSVDPATGTENDLTPFDGVQARTVAWSWSHPDEILIALNKRDPRFPDLYRVNIRTGLLTLVEENTRFSEFIADNDLKPRYALDISAHETTIYRKAGDEWIETETVPAEDAVVFKLLDFDASNRYLYMIDSRGSDTAALKRLDTQTGIKEVLAVSSLADVADVIAHPETGLLQAFEVAFDAPNWEALDPVFAPHLKNLVDFSGGSFMVLNRTRDDSKWVVYVDRQREPGAYYIYDTAAQSFAFHFSSMPEREGRELVAMRPVTIDARDGLPLVSYLSLPAGSDPDGDGRPQTALPLVLVVHSGPWYREKFGFHEWHQWLANRGYAVLSVNYRGSTGFGKAFLNAGNGEWGAKMQDDLLDAADWAVASGIADPNKIALFGGSYGGYAALAGLAFTPEKFACSVSVSGPANLITYLESVPVYWESMRNLLSARVGDPTTQEGQSLLEARSPLFRAGAMERPLLMAQGGQDPSVKQSEIEEIVANLTKRGVPVVYALYPDEAHGLKRAANALSFYAIADGFLAKCLGGKAEPIGDALKGTSVDVRAGAGYVPGLEAALRNR